MDQRPQVALLSALGVDTRPAADLPLLSAKGA